MNDFPGLDLVKVGGQREKYETGNLIGAWKGGAGKKEGEPWKEGPA